VLGEPASFGACSAAPPAGVGGGGRAGPGCRRAAAQGVAMPGFPTGSLLIALAGGWATLLPGRAAPVHGLLASSRRDLKVAVLRVRGRPGRLRRRGGGSTRQASCGSVRGGLAGAAGHAGQAAAGLGGRRHEPAHRGGRCRLPGRGLSHLLAVSGEKARQTRVLPDHITCAAGGRCREHFTGGQGVAGSNPVVPTARWAVPSTRGAAHRRDPLTAALRHDDSQDVDTATHPEPTPTDLK
jgi:hypothetical protein